MNNNESINKKNANNPNENNQGLSNQNKNTITYDEGWESVTESEYPVVASQNFGEDNSEESVNPKAVKKPNDSPKQLLITIQLIVCILIAIAALLIKTFGGEFYADVHQKYYSNLNNDAIFGEDENFNLNDFLKASTDDEV